jgi:hypothetical protein
MNCITPSSLLLADKCSVSKDAKTAIKRRSQCAIKKVSLNPQTPLLAGK